MFKILVVEDQSEISNIVVKYLKNSGYDYDLAKNGFEALEYFSKNTYHLILLDVMMPGIDGFEVLIRIREVSDIPVIMLTAKEEEVDIIKAQMRSYHQKEILNFSQIVLRPKKLDKI